MKRQDVINSINSLREDDSLRYINIVLVDSTHQAVYHKEDAEYMLRDCESCLGIIITDGNFIKKLCIPYKNILYVEGILDK